MQIYADVTGLEMKVARSAQTCALGSAMAGAVVAGKKGGRPRDVRRSPGRDVGRQEKSLQTGPGKS